ncbi:hypothetical protein PENSTE_c004G07422 [Penicillium steckii]|uniref:SMP-30/Gluconolactonase/LRE-like region domain-containing protein n=1 Tax=Penicillium steckii TaxID=303698 RepID=A0A1V6TMW2_9EURO|nr:hypothetical protein PENSTE_c004G07422 [Penicillium steckii]
MNLDAVPFLSALGLGDALSSPLNYLGLNQQPAVLHEVVPLNDESQFLNKPPSGFEQLSLSWVRDNLAVIPGEWEAGDIKKSFYDIKSDDKAFQDALNSIKSSDFIAWDTLFLNVIGPDAKLERIQSFEGEAPTVHEAPAYVPETNELFFSDTSVTGWLWAIEVDTLQTRKVETKPPLPNVNGARYHQGDVYLTTNGGSARGIWRLDPRNGTATPVVNNFRGRHLNSPNDLVFDAQSNMWFTDPPYGWYQGFPTVQPPEIPTGIYFFNMKTKALNVVSNNVVLMPNGLAFSPNGATLYIAESNSTSGKPIEHYAASLRNVWAFDVNRSLLSNPRLIHHTENGWPDGLQVTRSGYVLVAVFGGVDVVDPETGTLLGKINTPGDIIFNLEKGPRRANGRVWLLTGQKFIYKVTLKET